MTLKRLLYGGGIEDESVVNNINQKEKTTIEYGNGTYRGEYTTVNEKNIPNGIGKYKYSDSSEYDGEWKDGKKNGKGEYKYLNSAIYHGEWKDGKKNGKGELKDFNGQTIYDGEWEDDEPKGIKQMYIFTTNPYKLYKKFLENLNKRIKQKEEEKKKRMEGPSLNYNSLSYGT